MWSKFVDETCHVKVHYIIEGPLVAEIEEILADKYGSKRSAEYSTIESQIRFEPGGYGMYYLNQPRKTLSIGDIPIEIDCAKGQELLLELNEAEVKQTNQGSSYIVLYSRFCCLVLTLEQRDLLLISLRHSLGEMDQQAAVFAQEAEHSWQKARQKYQEEHGKQLPIVRKQDLTKKPCKETKLLN